MATKEIDIVLNELLTSLQNNYPETTEFLSSKVAELNASLDASVTDYNTAIDEIELRDQQLADLTLQINKLKSTATTVTEKPSLMVSSLTSSLERKDKELVATMRQYEIVFAEKNKLVTELVQTNKKLSEAQQRITKLNAKVADVDFISDQNEILREKIINREQEIERLNTEIRTANGASINKVDAAATRVSQLNKTIVKQSDRIKELERENKDFRKLDPARLKKNNIQLKKDNAEKTNALSVSRKETNKAMIDSTRLAASTKVLSKTLEDAGIEIRYLQDKLAAHDGRPNPTPFNGLDGSTVFYIYEYEYGLVYRAVEHHTPLLSDLDFNVEVKSNQGINVTISCTNWLQPFYPYCSEFMQSWPNDLHLALSNLFYERCKETHPLLIAKVEWSKGFELSNIKAITPRQLTLLHASKMTTIFDVCHLPQKKLHEAIKGMGDKTAHQIWLLCNHEVKLFEKQWQQQNKKIKVAA